MTSSASPRHRPGGFNAADLSLRAQKKVLSRVATRGIVRHFISPTATRLFDNLYQFLKQFYSKKRAEKVIKNMIKLCVKIGLVARGDHFPVDQAQHLAQLQRHLRNVALTVISFARLAFSYDRVYLVGLLSETRETLRSLIEENLSDKSMARADYVFEHVLDETMLDALFAPRGVHADALLAIAQDLERLIDERDL